MRHHDLSANVVVTKFFMNGQTWDLINSEQATNNELIIRMSGAGIQDFLRDLREGSELSLQTSQGRRISFSLAGSSNAINETIRVCRDFR
jgi:hypothetical protein